MNKMDTMKELLEDYRMYDIMTALRGPDPNSKLAYLCKYIFTERLRYWVGASALHRETKYINGNAVRRLFNVRLNEDCLPWWYHWFRHMGEALYAVGSLKPGVEDEANSLLKLLHWVNQGEQNVEWVIRELGDLVNTE